MEVKIDNFDIDSDLKTLAGWNSSIKSDPRFASIKHYIIEDDIYHGIDEVVHNNYEVCHFGDYERKYCFALRSENELKGFLMCVICDIQVRPELFLQYIVLHPDLQGTGVGEQILKDFLDNIESYVDALPKSIFCFINKENIQSLKLFTKMGFSFDQIKNSNYLRAHAKIKENVSDNERI